MGNLSPISHCIKTAAFSATAHILIYTLFFQKTFRKYSCIVMRIQVLCTADLRFHAKAVLLTSVNTAPPSRFPSGLWSSSLTQWRHRSGLSPDSLLRIMFMMQPSRYNHYTYSTRIFNMYHIIIYFLWTFYVFSMNYSVFRKCVPQDVRHNLWEISSGWGCCSGLRQPNSGEIYHKVGRANCGNDFSNRLWHMIITCVSAKMRLY